MVPIDLEIERVNKLLPYLGTKETSKIDDKGRMIVPVSFALISSARAEMLRIPHKFLYGVVDKDRTGLYIALYNYDPNISTKPIDIITAPISCGAAIAENSKSSTRINVFPENAQRFDQQRLIVGGRTDHFRVYKLSDWTKAI